MTGFGKVSMAVKSHNPKARVIGYLEQARSNNVADIRIALCVFALEALTHRLCLRDGLSAEQIAKMATAYFC